MVGFLSNINIFLWRIYRFLQNLSNVTKKDLEEKKCKSCLSHSWMPLMPIAPSSLSFTSASVTLSFPFLLLLRQQLTGAMTFQ